MERRRGGTEGDSWKGLKRVSSDHLAVSLSTSEGSSSAQKFSPEVTSLQSIYIWCEGIYGTSFLHFKFRPYYTCANRASLVTFSSSNDGYIMN